MALRPATRRLLREAGSWTIAAIIFVAAVSHCDTLKTSTETFLGTPALSDIEDRQRRDAEIIKATARDGPVVEIEAGRGGHFHTEAEINGRDVEVMIDTGATMVSLSYEDAERAGIYLSSGDFARAVSTANGVARVALVVLDRVSIGNITVRNVPATVAEPGRLRTSLLGMSFLGKLSRFDMRSGMLVLED